MHKFKKFRIRFTLLLTVILFLAASCKKDNANKDEETQVYPDNAVIGQWIYDQVKVNGVLSPYQHHPNCGKDRFYFRNQEGQDHDYEEVIYMRQYTYCAIQQTIMKWKIKGNDLILTFGTQSFTYKILRLTYDYFDVSIKVDYNGDGKLDDVEIYAVRKPCQFSDGTCQI
jgi:hypothetical protein